MDDLIEALRLMMSRLEEIPRNPFVAQHDEITVVGVDPDLYTTEELAWLDELGFFVSEEHGDKCFRSFRFGSA